MRAASGERVFRDRRSGDARTGLAAMPVRRMAGQQLVALVLSLIVVGGGVAALTLAYLRTEAIDAGNRLTDSFAQVVEEQTARTVETVDQRLQLAISGLGQLSVAGSLNQQSADVLLADTIKDLPYVPTVFVLDANGHVLFDSRPGSVGADRSDRDYFRIYRTTPTTGLRIAPPIRSSQTGKWVISLTRPLPSIDGTFTGIIVAGIEPDYFDSAWRSVPLGESGLVALLQRDGVMVLRSPLEDSVMGKRFGNGSLFPMLAKSPIGTFQQTSTVDGIFRIYAYRTLSADTNLVIVVGQAYDRVMARWRQMAGIALVTWLLASGALCVLAVFLHRAWHQRETAEGKVQVMVQRLALATDAASIGVWDWNLTRDEWYTTSTFHTMLGYPPEASGQKRGRLFERILPADREAARATHDAAVASLDVPYEFEARALHANGTYRWLEVIGRVLERSPDGSARRLLGVIIDITGRKQAEAELRASDAFKRAILDAVTDEIAVLDRNGIITAVNEAWRLYGLENPPLDGEVTPHTDVGADYLAACGPPGDPATSDAARARAGIEAVLHGSQQRFSMEYACHSPGRECWFNMSVTPLGHAGEGVVISQTDITERKAAEERLRELNASLELRVEQRTAELSASNKELDSFTYAVAHDLRAPLRGIDGFAHVLEDEYAAQLDDVGNDALRRVRGAAQRMGELIDDLLRLSHVTRATFVVDTFDMSELVRTVADDLHRREPARNVVIEAPAALEVRGDRRLILVLLENLLQNAWKFTSKHRTARIEVGVTAILGRPVYYVRDDGAGFNEGYASKLFKPFQRLHSMSDFPGTGIGLATVQRIVQRHGGNVWAEGVVERGAVFYFTLSA